MESERKSPLFLFHAWRLSLALCGLLKRRCQGLKMRICLPLAQINSTLKNFYLDSIVCIFLFFMMAIVCSLCWFLNRELRNICFVGFFRENSQKKTICIWSDSAPSYFFRSDNAQQWGNRTCKTSRAASYPKPYLAPKEVQNTSVMVHLPATLLTP